MQLKEVLNSENMSGKNDRKEKNTKLPREVMAKDEKTRRFTEKDHKKWINFIIAGKMGETIG